MRAGKGLIFKFPEKKWRYCSEKDIKVIKSKSTGTECTEVYDLFIYTEIGVRNSMFVTNHISFSVWMRPGLLAIIFLRKLST